MPASALHDKVGKTAGATPESGEQEPPRQSLSIVILGLSITSSWNNAHAAAYRGLSRALHERGHKVLFLERNTHWHAASRDLPNPPYCQAKLYSTLKQLKDRFTSSIQKADLTIVGSRVHEGAQIGEWVTRIAQGATAFYDIDTPVTMAKLIRGDLDYLASSLIPRYHIYLSSTGGPILNWIEHHYHSPMARPLYCSVDPQLYYPEKQPIKWNLGYMGAYSEDRQPALDELLLEPARCWKRGRFAVAGLQYPRVLRWPANVKRFTHLSPARHRAFYNAQQFTLNITRANMLETGYSPSVRLFEAGACATPVISDYWEGLEELFEPGSEILIARSATESLRYLLDLPAAERRRIGLRARDRVLAGHTASHRAQELETYLAEVLKPAAE